MSAAPIRIHAEAPPKPSLGEACNGCGLCCLAEPCPVGQLLTRRRSGSCELLRWDDAGSRYRCGLFGEDDSTASSRSGITTLAVRLRRRLATRWIAAGTGCDADLLALPGDG